MAEYVDDSVRLIIPRWRAFRVAANLSQLNAATVAREPALPPPTREELEALKLDWRANKTAVHAANLVDAALLSDDKSIGEEAARWILKHGGVSRVSLELAGEVLSPVRRSEPESAAVQSKEVRFKRIALYRRQLIKYPRDPLLWVDLAREYSSLGQDVPARKALKVALDLAPEDRFVLRSASRYFMHTNDGELAHEILRRSDATRFDPWLVAAEIAAAEFSSRRSRLTKVGVGMIDSGRFSPRHVSELASAIGTLEHDAGNRRKVRKNFAIALQDPTENSVAQAAWISRHMPGFDLPAESLHVPRAFEAQAWVAVQSERFGEAVALAWEWLNDEPFASRPAIFGAWVAVNAIGDYAEAERFAAAGLVANPEDPRLLADLLYCKASLDEVEGAEAVLPRLAQAICLEGELGRAAGWDVVLAADEGLLAYRRGLPEKGRTAYERAIELAKSNGLGWHEGSARLNHAREFKRANPGAIIARAELQAAVELCPEPFRAAMRRFADRIVPPESESQGI